jgi:hypothetical protein
MVTLWYPPNKGAEIAKIILKQPKELPFVTKWRVFNAAGGLDGLKAYHLIYTERGKAEEAMGEITKYFMPFLNVEGFRYLFEPLMGVSDSYALMGMKWE